MIEIESKLREWGRSIGVVIPKEKIKEENLKEGDKVKILILKEKNPIKETFGIAKLKRSTEEMLKESDEECWDE
jgi:antitoxin component of MazEF toxin-antitoxin module